MKQRKLGDISVRPFGKVKTSIYLRNRDGKTTSYNSLTGIYPD